MTAVEAALRLIEAGTTMTFDEDLGHDVEVWLHAEEMQEIARKALAELVSTAPARPTETAEIREALADDEYSAEEAAAIMAEADAHREPAPPPIPVRHRYYLTECEHCGWVGSSEHCSDGGAPDYDDVICPVCQQSMCGDSPSQADAAKHGEAVYQRIVALEAATAQAERTAGELAAAEALKLADDFEQSGATLYRPEQYPPGYERGWKEAHAYCARDLRTLAANAGGRAALTKEPPHAK